MHRMPFIGASGRRSPREWLPAVTLALLLASSAGADVVVKEKTVSEGLGGFGNGTSNRTLVVTGDKSRSEDEFTYTGRFKTLAGGGKARTTVSITRIDREVFWNLEPEKKQYTELTFAQMREAMQAGLAKADEESRKAQAQPEAKDAEMTFTVSVKRTGAKETINGFPTEQVVITCTGKPRNPEQAGTGEIRMVMDEWLTRSTPGAAEMKAYYKRLADKLGMEQEMSGINTMARRMYGNGLKELGARMKDLEGYPIRSTFTIEGSPESAAAQKQAAQDAAAAQEKAKTDRAKAKEAEAAADRAEDVQDAKDIGSSAASGSGGLTGRIGGFLARKAARTAEKKVEEKAEKKSGEMSSSGAAGGPLFKVVTEVTSISTSPVPAGSFDIPAGYKLQQQKKD